MVETQEAAYIYRFHDSVAMHTTGIDSCPTIYLDPDLAMVMGKALILFANSCKSERFRESPPPITCVGDKFTAKKKKKT